jgi:hypothetical protein
MPSNASLYQEYYLHFNFRLQERYGLKISFEEYMVACRSPYEDTGVQNTNSKKRKLIWVRIKGVRVLAIKNTKRDPKALITCLPNTNIHKYDSLKP